MNNKVKREQIDRDTISSSSSPPFKPPPLRRLSFHNMKISFNLFNFLKKVNLRVGKPYIQIYFLQGDVKMIRRSFIPLTSNRREIQGRHPSLALVVILSARSSAAAPSSRLRMYKFVFKLQDYEATNLFNKS